MDSELAGFNHLTLLARVSLQYFFASERPQINRLILQAIKRCDANGVKVFGLGALNKVGHPRQFSPPAFWTSYV